MIHAVCHIIDWNDGSLELHDEHVCVWVFERQAWFIV
jgi:hypothetical protein